MDPTVVVQARMGSARLPGKVLLPLGSRPVLGHVIDRCRSAASRVVVATSDGADDDAIATWCAAERVDCARGSRDDVLRRFVDAFDLFPAVVAVRVTADCPFVDPGVLRAVFDAVERHDVDYASLSPSWPLGLGSEGFRVAALREAERWTRGGAAEHAAAREHVTLYLYRHPERFRIRRLTLAHEFQEPLPRLTLDEPADYELLREVFQRFPVGLEPTTRDLAALFRREPGLTGINAHVRQNPVPS